MSLSKLAFLRGTIDLWGGVLLSYVDALAGLLPLSLDIRIGLAFSALCVPAGRPGV